MKYFHHLIVIIEINCRTHTHRQILTTSDETFLLYESFKRYNTILLDFTCFLDIPVNIATNFLSILAKRSLTYLYKTDEYDR